MLALIVSPDPEAGGVAALARALRARHGFTVPDPVHPDRAEARCRADDPDVVFVALPADLPDGAADVVRRLRGIGVDHLLVTGPATDPKLILRTLHAGADLFLDADDLDAELDAALARLRGEAAPARPGNLIAVLSAAGGCGASTVAVNLAALLAGARGRCHLIDLSLGRAALAPLLDLKPAYTLADLCKNDDRLDRSMYDKLLVRHRTGVALLAGPRTYADVTTVTTRGVERAVTLARECYPDVVVDLEDCFHDEQLYVLAQASRVLLVGRLDFTAVRNTRRVLDHLAARGVPRERIEVVMNQTGRPDDLPLEEAETVVGGPVSHLIPHDPATISAASNVGIPAAVTATTSGVVQAVAKIVGLDTPPRPTPVTVGRVVRAVKGAVAPRLQAIRERIARPPAPEPPPAYNPAGDTKVSHESIFSTEFRSADTRPLPAGAATRT